MTNEATKPHAYVREGVGRWRTCAVCGRGANAQIHKPPPPQEDENEVLLGRCHDLKADLIGETARYICNVSWGEINDVLLATQRYSPRRHKQ